MWGRADAVRPTVPLCGKGADLCPKGAGRVVQTAGGPLQLPPLEQGGGRLGGPERIGAKRSGGAPCRSPPRPQPPTNRERLQ